MDLGCAIGFYGIIQGSKDADLGQRERRVWARYTNTDIVGLSISFGRISLRPNWSQFTEYSSVVFPFSIQYRQDLWVY